MLPFLFQESNLNIQVRANRISRAILDLPSRDQPDVIVFNEVFNDEGRKWLLNYLKFQYPNSVNKLEHPVIDVEQDSGLMLFSKLPFQPLPTGGSHLFEVFERTAGDDSLASKGVGVVRVAGPYDPTTIAFTHLQASYDADNTDHMGIRADQFHFIREVLLKIAGTNPQHYANGVIAGDLNVKGDPDDPSGELNQVFAGTANTFGGDFDDSWRMAMHPPNDLTDYDPGYTQRSTETLIPNRFDYQCMRRNPNFDIGLVAHHLSTPIRLASEVTDHWALLGHLHRINENCSPASAVPLLKLPSNNPTQLNKSQVWTRTLEFRDEDMYHWVYIEDAGTFSVWCLPLLEVAAYRRSDFTNELEPTDILSLADLPSAVATAMTGGSVRVHRFTKGAVFSSREPFFLRFRGTSPSFQGKNGYGILHHRGESPETAIRLEPHLAINPDLPLGQPLGLNDECFFRVDRPNRYSQTPYDDHFVLDNPARVNVTVELRDNAQTPIKTVQSNDAKVKINRHGSVETLFIVLRRSNNNDINFTMTWDSPLSYMTLDESFRLHINDEVGVDWTGADELELNIYVDDVNVFSNSWDDADTGEDWPDLLDSVKASVVARTKGPAKWVAFTERVSFDMLKTDGISAHGSAGCEIAGLQPRDKDIEMRVGAINISDLFGDGHFTAHAVIGKFPLF